MCTKVNPNSRFGQLLASFDEFDTSCVEYDNMLSTVNTHLEHINELMCDTQQKLDWLYTQLDSIPDDVCVPEGWLE